MDNFTNSPGYKIYAKFARPILWLAFFPLTYFVYYVDDTAGKALNALEDTVALFLAFWVFWEMYFWIFALICKMDQCKRD